MDHAWTPQFGTSGIRGAVPEELTPEIAWRIGLSIAAVFKHGLLLLCHDNRTSSPLLAHAVASGLLAGGRQVLYGGQVITPAVSFYTRHCQLAGGVLITGSHIPAHMSGIEVLASDGAPVDRAIEQKIERLITGTPAPVSWNEQGTISPTTDVGRFWITKVLQQVDAAIVHKKNFRVTVDVCNGSAIPWLLDVITELGCTVVGVNSRPDPFFPGRSPNINVRLLKRTAQIVRDTASNLGVAVDGDGDRAFFIDDQGRALMGDITGTLLARIELERHGGGTIITPINSSNVVEDVVAQCGGKIVYSRVGPPAIVAAIKRHDAVFAFEESGKIIYPHLNYLSDSGLAAAHLLEHLAQQEVKLSTLVDELPRYYQLKQAIDCPDVLKKAVLDHAMEAAKTDAPKAKVVTVDGAKIIFDDGWLLLRPSGTEPVFRCFAEARSEARVQELFKLGLRWIDEVLQGHLTKRE